MATILITGGTGMIGTALSQMLTEKGYDVILLTRKGGGQEAGSTRDRGAVGDKRASEGPAAGGHSVGGSGVGGSGDGGFSVGRSAGGNAVGGVGVGGSDVGRSAGVGPGVGGSGDGGSVAGGSDVGGSPGGNAVGGVGDGGSDVGGVGDGGSDVGGSGDGGAAGGVSAGAENAVGKGRISRAQWDPEKGTIDAEAIRHADHIVHLAGAGVADKRWSEKRKREIVESRTHSSALIVKALGEIPNKVRTVVSASGIGWYGPDPSIPNPRPFVETDPVDEDFLGETCRLWEESISPVAGPAGRTDVAGRGGSGHGVGSGITNAADPVMPKGLDKRLVIFRIGLVLSNAGGALAEFRKPVRLGVAAILGSGKQVMSWIHVEDLCRLFVAAIENDSWSGVYNAVAPQPVDNKTLTLELAKRLKGRYYVPVYVPTFLLKIVVGEMSIEVLKSTTVSMQKLRQASFQFLHPSIQNALDDLIRK